MKLTPQEQKVFNYIRAHPGCTTRDIQRDLWIECPSARITGLRNKGVPVREVGTVKYPGARPFTKYAIGPMKRTVTKVMVVGDRAVRFQVTEEM